MSDIDLPVIVTISSDQKESSFFVDTTTTISKLEKKENINDDILALTASKDNSRAKIKCNECRKRLSLSNQFTCKCEKIFCSKHKYADMHSCSFDHKTEWKKIIEIKNPVVIISKIEKI